MEFLKEYYRTHKVYLSLLVVVFLLLFLGMANILDELIAVSLAELIFVILLFSEAYKHFKEGRKMVALTDGVLLAIQLWAYLNYLGKLK